MKIIFVGHHYEMDLSWDHVELKRDVPICACRVILYNHVYIQFNYYDITSAGRVVSVLFDQYIDFILMC